MSTAAIQLPQDQYAHPEAPTEWWWHIGTLTARTPTTGQIRTFGFEGNATGVTGISSFSQIMITDVQNQKRYQNSKIFPFDPNWAESDSSKPWFVKLGSPGTNGALSMTSPGKDINFMNVSASFTDADTSTDVKFDLEMHQRGPPLLVFGTGVRIDVNPQGGTPLARNNYYYSFTRISTTGTITIGSETLEVTGTTWMDHEYGAFPTGFTWALQDAMLDNGVQLSSFSAPNSLITVGLSFASSVTVIWQDGTSTYEKSVTTALNPTWKSEFPTPDQGKTYFLQYKVEVPKLDVVLLFNASMPDQEFAQKGTNYESVWEGIAVVEGSFAGKIVNGTAWIEQNFPKPPIASGLGGRAGLVGMAQHESLIPTSR